MVKFLWKWYAAFRYPVVVNINPCTVTSFKSQQVVFEGSLLIYMLRFEPCFCWN